MTKKLPSIRMTTGTTSVRAAGRFLQTAVCAVTLFVLMMFSFVNADDVGVRNRKANKLYNQGEYEEALRLYDEALLRDPSNGRLMMNRGSALYRLGELDEAERAYLDALSASNGLSRPTDKRALADAHYNLGNILYGQGERLELAGNASTARDKYSQALESYINALKLRPDDKDAKWNLQLAHQKVDILEGQPDQQQCDKNQNGDDDQEQRQDGSEESDEQSADDEESGDGGQDGDDENRDDRQQRQEEIEQDMRREEAKRLIEQFADDADTLNKPQFQRSGVRQPEKDW